VSTTERTLRVTPCDAALGAVVEGIDLAEPLSDDVVREVRDALLRHEVLFFPGQGITPEQQVAFGQRFGTLHTHAVLGSLEELPEVVVFDTAENAPVAEMWHSDVSCAAQPPLGSILQLEIVPPKGGATHWASMTAAYDALDDDTRARIAGLRGQHESWWKPVETAVHPVVRTHPENGRPSLYADALFTKTIVGMDPDEGRALIRELADHATSDAFTVTHEWRPGDIAFWDNRVTQHRVDNDFGDARRRGLRVTINGDTPR
jgi:taurine dioxygenase